MNISVSEAVGRVQVAIIRLDGQLDGQSYLGLIDKAKELYKEGARDFLVDLTDLTYISSAGLVALHSIALLTKGETLPRLTQRNPPVTSALGPRIDLARVESASCTSPRKIQVIDRGTNVSRQTAAGAVLRRSRNACDATGGVSNEFPRSGTGGGRTASRIARVRAGMPAQVLAGRKTLRSTYT